MQLDTMLTVDEYARLPQHDGHRLELIRGLLVRQPHPGPFHASVSTRIYEVLRAFAAHANGIVVQNAGFLLQEEPPTIRTPDVALLNPQQSSDGSGAVLRGAPCLAVEIAPGSLDGTRADLIEKAFEYIDAGAAAVWLIDLVHHSVIAFHAGAKPKVYRAHQRIIGAHQLTGLDLPVAVLFR
jgi:Uma2 family endonuclease